MLQMNFVSDTRKTAHTNIVTRKYVIMFIVSIFMIFEDSFLLCTFCIAVACGDVNYDYMPEAFVTWE